MGEYLPVIASDSEAIPEREGLPRRPRLSAMTMGTHFSGRMLFLLLSCLLACIAGCQTAKPSTSACIPSGKNISAQLDNAFDHFVFKKEFSAILTTLMTDSWDGSGDWKGDIQGDATAFAPMLLYAFARDTGDRDFLSMAERTVAYEAGLAGRFPFWPVPSSNLVVGFPALAQPCLQKGDPTYRSLFLRGVSFGYAITSLSPAFLTPFVRERACVYGIMGYMCLTAAEVADESGRKEEFIRKGIRLIEKANKCCWDDEESLYAHSHVLDWPQETMMMALTKAYRATGNRAYLDRAILVLHSMNRLCRDARTGGYYGHPDLETKGLSGNNNMTWVLLDLHEATGEGEYLEEARAMLKWILSDDLYDSSKGLICHHFTKGKGRAGYSCTGCNFHTLTCIYRYNVLLREHASARAGQGSSDSVSPR